MIQVGIAANGRAVSQSTWDVDRHSVDVCLFACSVSVDILWVGGHTCVSVDIHTCVH